MPEKRVHHEGLNYSLTNPVLLGSLSIEEKLQFRVTNNGRELVGNAKMFYDLVSSSGLTDKPTNNSKVIFNNHEYKIVDTDILCAESSTPHHYEVLLK